MGEPSTDVQGRVFISYRRDDTAYPAGWLFDRLAERFGVEQIFKDVDSIELGDDFVEVLDEAVGSTDVLLALIGDKWLTITGDDGRRRLDDPDDFVRLEIEAALKQKVRVIPILVEGAEMPSADELPSSLTPLARRQALELSSSRFTFDTDRLLAVLERTFADARAKETAATSAAPPDELEEPDIPPEPPEPAAWRQRLYERRRLLAAVAGAVVLLAALIGGIVLLGGDDPESTPPPTEEATTQEAPQEDPPPEGPSGDPANGAIAFVSDRSGENEIWTLPPDRSEPIQLTFDFEAGRPDWSPDGTQIVFASDRGNEDGDLDLWILDTEDGSERHLTRGPARDDAADWSPDGTQIAFGRASPGDSSDDIMIVDVASRDIRQITDDPADDDVPAWSSTGRIAFESNRDGGDFEIYTLNPAGLERDVQPVTSDATGSFAPAWSPDGRRIAYFSLTGRGPQSEIYTIGTDGTGQRRLTNNGAINRRPSWSPDGELIAFDSSRGRRTRLFEVPWNGGELRALPSGPGSNAAPSWGAQPK